MPLVKRIKQLTEQTQSCVLKEKIDLTGARNFQAQQTSEDIICAPIEFPFLESARLAMTSGWPLSALSIRIEMRTSIRLSRFAAMQSAA